MIKIHTKGSVGVIGNKIYNFDRKIEIQRK